MEDNDYLETGFGNEILNQEVRDKLFSASKWAKILAIFYMVFLTIGLVGILSSFIYVGPKLGMEMGLIMGIYLPFIIFGFYITYKLFEFGKFGKLAAKSDDQALYYKSFASLSTFFKIIGIMLIITIGFYLLLLLFFGSAFLSGVYGL